jgi:hypothetical protein
MPRSQASQPKLPLKDRMALHASRLTEEAKSLRPGPERDALMQRAHHADTASHADEWLLSPRLQPGR